MIAPLLPSSLTAPVTDWRQYKGANPNSVALSPDETQLYVTDGNLNCIAVVALSGTNSGDQVIGLIPTGWYPNSVSFSGDGNRVYVINGKSPTGANPDLCYGGYGPPGQPTCFAANEYNPQLIKAGLQSFPASQRAQLATLTAQVATNNRFSSTESANDAAVMAAVRQGVQHVIFILKENRTYDQVLGDLPSRQSAIRAWLNSDRRSRRICITWRATSSRSTTSWPPPKSATTAGCGALRRSARRGRTNARWPTRYAA